MALCSGLVRFVYALISNVELWLRVWYDERLTYIASDVYEGCRQTGPRSFYPRLPARMSPMAIVTVGKPQRFLHSGMFSRSPTTAIPEQNCEIMPVKAAKPSALVPTGVPVSPLEIGPSVADRLIDLALRNFAQTPPHPRYKYLS